MQIVWRYRGSFCANTYYGIIKSFEYSKEVSQQQLGVGVFVLLELPRMKFRVQRMFRAIFSLVVICSCYVRAHLLHLANIFVRVFVVFKHVFDNLRLVRGALGVFARLQEKSRLPRAALQSSPLSPLCSLPLF